MSLFIILYLTLVLTIFSFLFKNLILSKNSATSIAIHDQNQKSFLFLLFSFCLLAFSIPFYRVAASIPSIFLLVSIAAFFIVHRNNKEILNRFFSVQSFYLYLFVAWPAIVLIHSIIFKGSFNKLLLNILPLFYFIAFTVIAHQKQIIRTIAKFFIIGSVLAIPLFIGLASLNFDTLSWKTFYYTNLLFYIKGNPITHSFYYNIAILLAAKLAFENPQIKIKILYVIAIVFFLFVLILFGSKIGYLTTLVTIIFLIITLIKSYKLKLFLLIFIVSSLYIIYSQIPYVNNKINGFKWQVQRHDKIDLNLQLPRSIIWPEAITLIKEKPITGYGVGNGYESLKSRYKEINYQKGLDLHFNAHNQFLESFIQLGIIGFIWWMLLFVFLIYMVFKQKNKWLFQFLVLFFCYLMVESLFESQMGMVPIAFFLPIFLMQKNANYLK